MQPVTLGGRSEPNAAWRSLLPLLVWLMPFNLNLPLLPTTLS
jgi:hypothetical protein